MTIPSSPYFQTQTESLTILNDQVSQFLMCLLPTSLYFHGRWAAEAGRMMEIRSVLDDREDVE